MSCSPASCGQVIIAGSINQTCSAIQILLTDRYLWGINIYLLDVMLISELLQGSVTAWGWPHRDIPCPRDTSLQSPVVSILAWLPLVSSLLSLIPARRLGPPREPRAHLEQQPTIKCGSDRENKSWAPGERSECCTGVIPALMCSTVSLHSLSDGLSLSLLYSIDHCVFDDLWTRRWAHVKLQTVILQFGFVGEQIYEVSNEMKWMLAEWTVL